MTKVLLITVYKIQSLLCWLAFRNTGYQIIKWGLDKRFDESLKSLERKI